MSIFSDYLKKFNPLTIKAFMYEMETGGFLTEDCKNDLSFCSNRVRNFIYNFDCKRIPGEGINLSLVRLGVAIYNEIKYTETAQRAKKNGLSVKQQKFIETLNGTELYLPAIFETVVGVEGNFIVRDEEKKKITPKMADEIKQEMDWKLRSEFGGIF